MQQENILHQRLAEANNIKARAHSKWLQQPHPTSTTIVGRPDGLLYYIVLLDRGTPQSHAAKNKHTDRKKHASATDVSDGSKSSKIQKPKPRVIPDKQVDTGFESGEVWNKDLLPSTTPVGGK
jgi:hypothetical protein